MITPESIREDIAKLKEEAGHGSYDRENLHRMEDAITWKFAKYVEELQIGYLSQLAKEVADLDELDFVRWYS